MNDETFIKEVIDVISELDANSLINKALIFESMTLKERIKLLEEILITSEQEKSFFQTKDHFSHKFIITFKSIIGTIGKQSLKKTFSNIKQILNNNQLAIDNYNEILKGINITSNYLTAENFNILAKQKLTADKFKDTLKNIYEAKYYSNISTKLTQMEEERKEILVLTKKYKTN